MADSDNSTTLPSVTRRRLMAATTVVTASWPLGASACKALPNAAKRDDPAIALCKRWQKVHLETLAFCERQQQLEAHLCETIGFPSAKARDFAELQARWNAADAEVGYSKAQRRERASQAAEQELLDELPYVQSSSIEGILAKLSVILCNGEHDGEPDDFPWPHVRSVFDDLVRLHQSDLTIADGIAEHHGRYGGPIG